jgi:hypothetical protein
MPKATEKFKIGTACKGFRQHPNLKVALMLLLLPLPVLLLFQ